jgi:hypothetical protein
MCGRSGACAASMGKDLSAVALIERYPHAEGIERKAVVNLALGGQDQGAGAIVPPGAIRAASTRSWRGASAGGLTRGAMTARERGGGSRLLSRVC